MGLRRTHKNSAVVVLLLTLMALGFQNFIMPEAPSRNIDTRTVQLKGEPGNEKYTPTSNHIPVTEFSHDGRLSLHWAPVIYKDDKGAIIGGGPRLLLARPEKVQDYLMSRKNPIMGANLVNEASSDQIINVAGSHRLFKSEKIDMTAAEAKTVLGAKLAKGLDFGGRVLLCEKTQKNPMVCGGNKDCYNATIIVRYGQVYEYNETVVNPTTQKTSVVKRERMKFRFVSNDVKITVSNPKTPAADVESVQIIQDTLNVGPLFDYPISAEPTISGDGRLLVTRLSSGDVYLSDMKTMKSNIDVVYSVYPTSVDGKATQPCDVTRWKAFHPISHAYYDSKNKMKERYKFARYPLRDSLGNVLANGEEFGVSYPWIDKGAANLFFTTFGKSSFYVFNSKTGQVDTPFPERAGSADIGSSYFTIKGVTDKDEYNSKRGIVETTGNVAGFAMAGLWTHGKVVLLDGLVNNGDFLFRISDRWVKEVQLKNSSGETYDGIEYFQKTAKFKDPETTPGFKRVEVPRQLELYSGGKYETVGSVRERGENTVDYRPLLTANATFMGSVENRLNYNKAMMPVTPRDVVWHFGTSRHTEEVAFDDYTSIFMLINAEMTAAVQAGASSMLHMTGYQSGQEVVQTLAGFPRTVSRPYALIQNSGTAPDSYMTLPYYGKIDLKYSRIEPIAKGGVFGKGLWMEELGALQFQVPPQITDTIAKNKNWYVGAFIDGRGNSSVGDRVDLFTLGDLNVLLGKARASSHLYDRLIFLKNGKRVGIAVLPGGLVPFKGIWSHIGISFSVNKAPEVFFNGMSVGSAVPEAPSTNAHLLNLVSLAAGNDIYLGNSPTTSEAGIRGWFDEFKVVARVPTYEEACNFARGTLIELSAKASDDATWSAQASRYPAAVHEKIAKAIYEQNPARKFACYTRYFYSLKPETRITAEDHAHLKNLPVGAVSIREEMIGMKNALIFGRPRPNFENNQFCLSCHTSYHDNYQKDKEMGVVALSFSALNMQEDARRQPMQPARFLRGVVPANYFGVGMPSRTIASNVESEITQVDQFIHANRKQVYVTWPQLGSLYDYALDVRNPAGKVISKCVNAGVIKNTIIYGLSSCVSAGNVVVPITNGMQVRVCYGLKTKGWNPGDCSEFKPLDRYDEHGMLRLYFKK